MSLSNSFYSSDSYLQNIWKHIKSLHQFIGLVSLLRQRQTYMNTHMEQTNRETNAVNNFFSYCFVLFCDLYHRSISSITYTFISCFVYKILFVNITNYSIKISNNFIFVYNSSVLNMSCGVPHGSCLGPILFLLYINDFLKLNLINSTLISYADILFELSKVILGQMQLIKLYKTCKLSNHGLIITYFL